MHLIFDARHIAAPFTGLGRYTACLLGALTRGHCSPGFVLTALVPQDLHGQNNPLLTVLEGYAREGRLTLRPVRSRPFGLSQHFTMGRELRHLQADHYFYPHFDLPLSVRGPASFVVHDVIPLAVDGYIRQHAAIKRLYFRAAIWLSLARCRRCFAVSRTTRRDVSRLSRGMWDHKLDYAYEGPFSEPAARAMPSLSLPSGLSSRFLLYVGDRRPHKQLHRLIAIFRHLKAQHGYDGQLVLAGSTANFADDLDTMIRHDDAIRVLGNVPDEVLSLLYRQTDGLCLLSSYEGFGLPVVEAVTHGCRVIVSDGGALPELAPDSACVIPNQMPVPAAAAKLAQALSSTVDTTGYAELLQACSWDQAARKIFPFAFAQGSPR